MNSKTFAFERVERINGTSPTHTHTRKHSLSECFANNVHHFFCDTPTQQRNATLCHASGKRKPLGQCVPWKLLSRWGQFTYEMSRKKNETWLVDLLTYYVVGLPIRQVTVYVCGSCWDWGRLFFLGVMMIRMIIYQFVTGSTWIVVEVSPAQFFVAPSKGLRAH